MPTPLPLMTQSGITTKHPFEITLYPGKRYIFSTKSVSSTIKEWDPLHKTYAPQDVESVNGALTAAKDPDTSSVSLV